MAMKPKAKIYTDGACSGNPGPGGWASVIIIDGKEEQRLSGGDPSTTNNRMEIMAVINALNALKGPHIVELYTDSRYVVDAFNKNWLKSWKRNGWARNDGPLKNKDLWQTLDKISQKHSITWNWVKGHNGNTYNELCDKMATGQAAKYANGGGEDFDVSDCAAEDTPDGTFFDEDSYEQELISMPVPVADEDVPPDEEPECPEYVELSADDVKEALEAKDFLMGALERYIRTTGKELYKLEKPCGMYEFCDFCTSSGKYPCASAYVAQLKEESSENG